MKVENIFWRATPKLIRGRAERRAMVAYKDPVLLVSQQCRLLAAPRSPVYRRSAEVNGEDCAIMALIGRHSLARLYYGLRRMAAWLATQGHRVNRKRVQRLMRLIGLAAICQRPNTSKPATAHKVHPISSACCRSNGSTKFGARHHLYPDGQGLPTARRGGSITGKVIALGAIAAVTEASRATP